MVAREVLHIIALVVAIVLTAAVALVGIAALGVVLAGLIDLAQAVFAWLLAHDRVAGALIACVVVGLAWILRK